MKELLNEFQEGSVTPLYKNLNNQNPYNNEVRRNSSYSDELILRRARIYKILGPKDDRIQVRPVPEFSNIDSNELDNLPKYPPFVKGQVVTGLAESDVGIDKADYVWIFCTSDYSIGYIIDIANIFANNDSPDKKWPYSYNYKSVKDYLVGRKALPDDFDYKNIKIVRWIATDKGGFVEFYNHQTGDWAILNTGGSIITCQQKKIYLRVGSPANPPTIPNAFSAITITADKIHLKSSLIELDGKKVILAHHGLQLASITPGVPCNGTNGINVMPVENVFV